jgi:hypothetical protein
VGAGLEQATQTRVANTMTVNPIAAGLLATQLGGEPITVNLIVELVAAFAGIWIATTEGRSGQNTYYELALEVGTFPSEGNNDHCKSFKD